MKVRNPSKFALRSISNPSEFLGTIGLPVTDKRYAKTFDSIAAATTFRASAKLVKQYEIVWIA